MNEQEIEVAASLALEQISSSAHARSQPATPSIKNKKKNQNQTNILDIFMSPDKPKSKLRQMAESSTKKYSNRSSLPTKSTANNTMQSSPTGFILDLGIPTKPTIDLKAFAFKPPSRRSLGPRRSSIVSRKSHSPTKSPKSSIENLLDDLDIIDTSKPLSNQKNSRKSHPRSKSKSKETSQEPFIQSSSHPPATRKSRRVTVVHLSSHQSNLDTIQDSKEDMSLPIDHSETVNCDTSDQCDVSDPRVEDDESTCSNDSFDPNTLLIPKLKFRDKKLNTKPEIGAKKVDTKQAEINKTEDEDNSIIVRPRRSSKRHQLSQNSRRVIPDSDSENDDETRTSTLSSKPPKSKSRVLSHRSHQRETSETSLKANHSMQKSPRSNLIDVDDTSSDDSIEILPSRALQFHKSRALAISKLSGNVPNFEPSDNLIHEEKKSMPRDHHKKTPSTTEEQITIKPKPIVSMGSPIKKSTNTNVKVQPKPAATESTKKVSSKKTTGETKKKPIAFSKIRDDLAEELIDCLDEQVFNSQLPEELEVVWSKRLNTTAGRAKWSIVKDPQGNILREKVQIELATKVIDDEAKLRNTLSHELCHVACWFIDRQKDEKHGKYFKAWARKINMLMPDIKVTTKHDYVITYKFNWRCSKPECPKVYGRHSNSIDTERQGCVCGGKLIRVPKTSQKPGVETAGPSTTNETAPPPDENVLSVEGELTGRFKDLTFTQDLIEL